MSDSELPGAAAAEPIVETLSVSVVIPTRNRPEDVVRAVQSALGQSLPPIEVVVVVDGPDRATAESLRSIGDPRVRILELARNGGAARARNTGVANCVSDWVAFLDDDDEWRPEKLSEQAQLLASEVDANRLVLATGVERRTAQSTDFWPQRPPSPQESVSDYLFIRRMPGEGLLLTSSIMLRRDLAVDCPLPEHLTVHEEWDWFISLEKAGASFRMLMQPLVIYNAPRDRTSVSTDAQWVSSLAWALSRRNDMSPRAFSEFCLTEVARLAKQAGSLRALVAVWLIASDGKLSWFASSRFLALCIVPTGARLRLIGLVQGRRGRLDRKA